MKLSEQLRDAGLEEMAERAEKLEKSMRMVLVNEAIQWADFDFDLALSNFL